MKRISFKNLDSLGIDRISKQNLKKINGGNMCADDEFTCGNGICIPRSYQMDGVIDCPAGSDEQSDAIGSCGVNYYDTYGSKFDESRGLSKSYAQQEAANWNAYHQSTCTSECGAIAKWCCDSC